MAIAGFSYNGKRKIWKGKIENFNPKYVLTHVQRRQLIGLPKQSSLSELPQG